MGTDDKTTPVNHGYGAAETVASTRSNKKRCAYTGQGVHYFEPQGGEIFCCRCRKRDERDGPTK